jgi:integrase
MAGPEATAFLNHLAVQRRVSASTQNQALCAIVFLYRRVLNLEMPALDGLSRARRPVHLPAVLSRGEVQAILHALEPPFRLIAEMIHGSGLRLLECLSLRVKDVDLERHRIMVRRGKEPIPVRRTEPSKETQVRQGGRVKARRLHVEPDQRRRAPRLCRTATGALPG